MNAKRSSYLIITLSLVAVFMLAIAAGCTSNGSTNAAATQAPVATPTVAATSVPAAADTSAVQATAAAPVTTSAPVSTGQKQTIKISGSTTVLPIVQAAADKYMAAHPDADIQVSGGGSGVGVQAIAAKTVDIGMSSREITAAEKVANPNFNIIPVAQDGIAIIVNPANTIPYITMDEFKSGAVVHSQVSNIYLGKLTKWTEISGAGVSGTNNQIVIVGRDSASGTRTYFDQTVLGTATATSKMMEMNSNGAVAQTVAQTPGAIGYVSIGFLTPDVKAVPIWFNADKIITPSIATVKDGSYPFSRNLYVITQGKPTGLAGDFIAYILSPEGQQIVNDQGYVKLS